MTSTHRYSPAAARATEFLHATLQSARNSALSHLPSVNRLSAEAGVSLATMHAAVQRCVCEGHIRAERGRGLFLTSKPPVVTPVLQDTEPGPTFVAVRPSWAVLKGRIDAELFDQTYPAGTVLPEAKELRNRYGVGPQTLTRALNALVADGRLERYRRGFRAVVHGAPTAQPTIAMIATMDLRELLTHLGPRATAMWRGFEEECQRSGVQLDIYDYRKSIADYPWPDGAMERLIDRIDLSRVLGFVVWPFAMRAEQVGVVCEMLNQTSKPVSVLYETWVSPLGEVEEAVAGCRAARLFAVAMSGRCAEAVAEHLVQLGHRRIAVVSPAKLQSGWRTRAEAIQRVYVRAGVREGVTVIEPSDSNSPPTTRQAQLVARLDRVGTWFHNRLRDRVSESFFSNSYFPYVAEERLALQLEPHFERALADSRITAWVGLSDAAARAGLHFLSDRDIVVPGRISVAGIDNDSHAFSNGLTTYDFNMHAVVRAMLDHIILYSRGPSARRWPPSTEVPGSVIVRSTTGPARAGGG